MYKTAEKFIFCELFVLKCKMLLCRDLLKRQNAYSHSLQSQEHFMYGATNTEIRNRQINKEKRKRELKQQTARNKQTRD